MVGSAYLIAFAITISIETPIVAAFYPGRRAMMALVCLAATSITHFLMHFVLPEIIGQSGQVIFFGELVALIAEGFAYGLFGLPRNFPKGFLVSAVANSASYGGGLIYFGVLG